MNEHILIENVTPSVNNGRYPVKRVVGEPVEVTADIFRDGHQLLHAVIQWRRRRDRTWKEAPLELLVNDAWRGSFTVTEVTTYEFTVQAWSDVYGSWLEDFEKRVAARMDITSELIEGEHLLEGWLKGASARDRAQLERSLAALRAADGDGPAALKAAAHPPLLAAVRRAAPRTDAVTHAPVQAVVCERQRALFSAWYEMFPRSQGREPGQAATLRDAEWRLPEIADLGFDVVYLPPVHPIGTSHRKGRNNALTAAPDDPGSPWAIGSPAGGHMAVEPALGTLADFDHFVDTARNLGMEVALDFAIQASPDHPWVKEHPEWFHHRPDGTIKYAENPPKKYQDIYPLNFDTPNAKALWEELRRVVLFWVEHGVRIFRVDNPHTKPFAFWEWLIASVQSGHRDVIFLSEAFTRPKKMKALAKLGFTQSYTYFTWRNGKQELREYLEELSATEMAEYFRPNFFTNTPDILSDILVRGGRPAFKMRLVLAATLSPSYGIYSGYELCENVPVAGTEEYLDSEKYQIKTRDWHQQGNLNEFIARVNALRRENPALQSLRNVRFLECPNGQVLAYVKATAGLENALIVVVNLDPFHPQETLLWVPPEWVGVSPGERYEVHDLLTGALYNWGAENFVRLDPLVEPAHILRIERRGL